MDELTASEPVLISPLPKPPVDDVIKPLETHYAGCRFRSRLEARWAVFFEFLGIEWLYEPEGFMVADKPYLPDFYLPKLEIWAEVKGVLDQATLEHLVEATDPRSGLPASPAGDAWLPSFRSGRILMLGAIPRATKMGWLHTRLDFIQGEPIMRGATFIVIGGNVVISPFGEGRPMIADDLTGDREFILSGGPSGVLAAEQAVVDGYSAARKARFEHGESGTPTEALNPPKIARRTPRKAATRKRREVSAEKGPQPVLASPEEGPLFRVADQLSDGLPQPVSPAPARRWRAE